MKTKTIDKMNEEKELEDHEAYYLEEEARTNVEMINN